MRCLLFALWGYVCGSLFHARWWFGVVRWLLFGVCWLLFDVCCVSRGLLIGVAVRCRLVGAGWLFVVRCVLCVVSAVCCVLVVGCRLLFVGCWALCVV